MYKNTSGFIIIWLIMFIFVNKKKSFHYIIDNIKDDNN